MSQVRKCRDCGCSQNDACVGQDGQACYWAEPDLCSSCAAGAWPVYRMIGGAINRQDVKGGAWTALSKDDANTLLEHFAQFSRRRFAGVGYIPNLGDRPGGMVHLPPRTCRAY